MLGIEQQIVVLLFSLAGVEQPPKVDHWQVTELEDRTEVIETLEEMSKEGGALEGLFETSTQFPTEPGVSAHFEEREAPCCRLTVQDEQMRGLEAPFGTVEALGSVSISHVNAIAVTLPHKRPGQRH